MRGLLDLDTWLLQLHRGHLSDWILYRCQSLRAKAARLEHRHRRLLQRHRHVLYGVLVPVHQLWQHRGLCLGLIKQLDMLLGLSRRGVPGFPTVL